MIPVFDATGHRKLVHVHEVGTINDRPALLIERLLYTVWPVEEVAADA